MVESESTVKLRSIGLLAAWLLFWVGTQFWLLAYYGVSFQLALTDSVITQGCLLLDAYVEIMMVRFYRPSGKNSFYLFISSAALSLVFVSLLNWLLKMFIVDASYLQLLSNTLVIRFLFMWLMMLLIGVA